MDSGLLYYEGSIGITSLDLELHVTLLHVTLQVWCDLAEQ